MIIEELAHNVINTKFETFDKEVIEQAKNRLIDIVGCTIGGANAPGCPELRDLIKDWGGQEEASILLHGGKVPAYNAAWINSTMARSFDFGVLTPYIGERPIWSHIEESTVPTAITIAEWKHTSGKEMLTALILGDDLTTRIAAASAYAPAVSWDSPGIVNKFGTTAIAARLMGLSEHQLLHAFGIVLNQMAGSFQTMQDATTSFKLAQGLAARDGIVSAQLAEKGWTGGKDALLGKYGYFSIYAAKCDPEYLTRDLGQKFYGDLTFKPYPCCRFIHSPIDCALQLVHNHDINAADISEVTLDVSPMHVNSPLSQPFEISEFVQGSATFSFRYNIANVLIRKGVKLDHYTKEAILDPEVGALARKIKVTDKMAPEKIESAVLTVRMKDGRELSASVDCAKGNALKKPLSKNEIERKFKDNVAFSQTISPENADKLIAMLNNIENIDDVNEVINLLII